MYEIKNSKPVKENERVRYRCARCAECCRHVKGAVIVESWDAYRLALYLGMEMADFYLRYTDMFFLEDTDFPIFALNAVGREEACVFLDGSRCTVQNAKPRTCRLYPFWVAPDEPDCTTFTYHLSTERKHHPKGSIVRAKDWMKEHFWKEDQAFLKEEWQSVRVIAPLMREAARSGVKSEVIHKLLLYFRYFAFELGEPFLPQQHRNNCELIAVLIRMIKENHYE